jgi:hypothetical protein
MMAKKEISLAKAKKQFKNYRGLVWNLHILSSNRFLIFKVDFDDGGDSDDSDHVNNSNFKMIILDKNANVISHKFLKPRGFMYVIGIEIKANASHIFAFDRINSNVRIYNFNLKLVHSFLLDRGHNDLKLHNFELAFFNAQTSLIACYDSQKVKTKKKQICLNRARFLTFSELKLGID